MAASDEDELFIFRDIPKTTKDAIARASFGQAFTIIDSALRHYLDEFMKEDGKYRDLITDVAPNTINYHTNTFPTDPTTREAKLASLWKNLKMQLPMILIANGGADYKQGGLGRYDGGMKRYPNQSSADASPEYLAQINLNLSASVEIYVAALDKGTAEAMMSMVNLAFGPLSKFLINGTIQPANRKWVVRLPENFSMSALASEPWQDDPNVLLWTGSITLSDLQFEDHTLINYVRNLKIGDISGATSMTTEIPDMIKMGKPSTFKVHNIIAGAKCASSDASVGILRPDGTLLGKKPGTFDFIIYSNDNGQKVTHECVSVTVVP